MSQAQGAKFYRATGSPLSYTQIAGLVGIGDIDMTREPVDTTLMDQVGKFMTKEGSKLIDGGEIELTLEFDPTSTGEANLYTDFKADANGNYRISLPIGSPNATFSFEGFVSNWGASHPATDRMVRTVTFTLSGEPTASWI